MTHNEQEYLEAFLAPVRKCKEYQPRLGQGTNASSVSLEEFKTLYGSDPFYAWIGLNTNHMYAAHRVAGGMTSVYRQVGIGCERLFRSVLVNSAAYTDSSLASWSYTTKTSSGKTKTLSLDGRLGLSDIKNDSVLKKLKAWMGEYCASFPEEISPSNGVVFEVRQGHKSRDSKRQNADIDNATVAWAHNYLPVFAVFSSQIDPDIVLRYRNNRCGILTGVIDNDSQLSLYAFFREVLGYDLADFFARHSSQIREEIDKTLAILLSTG